MRLRGPSSVTLAKVIADIDHQADHLRAAMVAGEVREAVDRMEKYPDIDLCEAFR
jgi:hypothetical protein